MPRPIPPREWEEEILRMRARIVALEESLGNCMRIIDNRLYVASETVLKQIKQAREVLEAHNEEDELKPGGGL